jgi:hypothetical protein
MHRRKLRPVEEFVIRNLATSFRPRASWWSGEDPPDCYLKVGEEVIAVEISTLCQLVTDDHGESIPRLSQDMTAVRICNQLDIELKHVVPKGTTIYLTLEAPLTKPGRFKSELSDVIKRSIQSPQKVGRIAGQEILSNRLKIQIIKTKRSSRKRVLSRILCKFFLGNLSEEGQICTHLSEWICPPM